MEATITSTTTDNHVNGANPSATAPVTFAEWEQEYIADATAAETRAELPNIIKKGKRAVSPLNRLLAVEDWLNDRYLERRDEIRIALTAIVAEEHVCFIGKKGSAKTEIMEKLVGAITGARLFSTLCSPDMKPEDLVGAVSVTGWKAGRVYRETEFKLAWAHVAIADEIWKAKGWALNIMLRLLNERSFQSGKGNVPTPSQLFTLLCASNEMPQDDGGVSLAPLQDRILFWKMVDYPSKGARNELLRREAARNIYPHSTEYKSQIVAAQPTIALDELRLLQQAAWQIELPDSIIEALDTLRDKLAEKGIELSPRRELRFPRILKAHALLEGRTVVDEEDLRILQYCCWERPEQYAEARKIVNGLGNPLNEQAQNLLDTGMRLFEEVMAAHKDPSVSSTDKTSKVLEANGRFASLVEEAEKLLDVADKKGKSAAKIEYALAEIEKFQEQTGRLLLGKKTERRRARTEDEDDE